MSINWIHIATVRVRGHPVPQNRPRVYRHGGVMSSSPTVKTWRDVVALEMMAAKATRYPPLTLPLTGPVRVDLRFMFARPKRDKRKETSLHDRRPDRDNLDKVILDCLEKCRWVESDAQVVGSIYKWWLPAGDTEEGVQIDVYRLAEPGEVSLASR